MQIHGRGKLGPAGWLALVQAVAEGMTVGQAAARFGVSVVPSASNVDVPRRQLALVVLALSTVALLAGPACGFDDELERGRGWTLSH